MILKPGDLITFYPSKHPCVPREAQFIDQKGLRARIRLTDPDGSTRTIQVCVDNIEAPRRALEGPDLFQAAPGMRGGF